VVPAESESVGAFLVEVHFGRYLGLSQGEVKVDTVFGRHAPVFIGVDQEGGGCLGRDLPFIGKILDKFFVGIVTEKIPSGAGVRAPFYQRDDGVDKDHKVGPATEPVDGVFCIRFSRVKVSSCRGGQMTTSRKAEDAYPVGIDVPFLGPAANGADGSLCVL